MEVSARTWRVPRFWIRLLAVVFFVLAGLGWLRFVDALRDWDLLVELGVNPGPLYIAAGGALWGLMGLPVGVGLLGQVHWSIWAARLAAVAFPLTYWADRLAFSASRGGMQNWPFTLAVTALWLVFVWLVLPANSRG